MIKQIKFKETVHFKGRNGLAKCTGIDLHSATSAAPQGPVEVVILFPITSKGEIASSWIDLPIDSITEFIKELNQYNPEPLILDTSEIRFLDYLHNLKCPYCSKKGFYKVTSHSKVVCEFCYKSINLNDL